MRKCVFAGSFDPPTTGHKYVADCCLQIFDEVVIAVMVNTQKKGFLPILERKALLEKLYADEPRVRVITFEGAAVDLLAIENTRFYVRGVRDCIDFEYENRDLYASREYMPGLIGIYIPAPEEGVHVSSTLVKNCIYFGKDYTNLIPKEIREDFDAAVRRLEKKD